MRFQFLRQVTTLDNQFEYKKYLKCTPSFTEQILPLWSNQWTSAENDKYMILIHNIFMYNTSSKFQSYILFIYK